MKNLIVIFWLLTMGTAAQDIEHAPTIEQCKADWRLWNYQDMQPVAFSDLTLKQLHSRAREMQNCVAVDPDYKTHYWNMSNEFSIEAGIRADHFLSRHGFMQQFIDEDAKGAR